MPIPAPIAETAKAVNPAARVMFVSNRARSFAIHAMADSWAIWYKTLASCALLVSNATRLPARRRVSREPLVGISRGTFSCLRTVWTSAVETRRNGLRRVQPPTQGAPPDSGQPTKYMTHHTNAFPDLDRDLRFIPLGVEEPGVLSPAQVRRYNEVGHLFPIDIFSPGEIAEIRAYIDDLLPKALAAGWNSYEVVNWHKSCRGIWDIVTEPRIIDVVADLLGDSVILRHSHLFAKLPGDAKRVAWHQDASYWPLSPSRVVTAWLAIDDVDTDNSAMQVIPRSHHHAQVAFRDSTTAENSVLVQTVDDPGNYGDPPVALEMRAGQISLHSDWIL
ncbi:MAG: phytanoyl-CoA dioxygenase family protein, partial [Chloroflexi bacterium]|nr:phytanoyl-CoA dioxygenase family protein [Chloroflexota bacterium]